MGRKPDCLRYKTELCKNWIKGGCTYAHKCRFAHGADEIRPLPLGLTPNKDTFITLVEYQTQGIRPIFIDLEGRNI